VPGARRWWHPGKSADRAAELLALTGVRQGDAGDPAGRPGHEDDPGQRAAAAQRFRGSARWPRRRSRRSRRPSLFDVSCDRQIWFWYQNNFGIQNKLRLDNMTQSEQAASPTLQALQDGKLAGSWTLDSSKTEIGLKSKSMWGMVSVKGVFREVSGTGTVSAAGDVAGVLTVAAGSIDTKMKKRDEHLRSADFFDVDSHPDITFAAKQVQPSGQGATVTGDLTVRGTTRPVSFAAQVSSVGDAEVSLDGEVQVNRADFGLTWNQLGMSSVHNAITVHAVFTRQ
jgi:polyisoprenoid-binding protein YceI